MAAARQARIGARGARCPGPAWLGYNRLPRRYSISFDSCPKPTIPFRLRYLRSLFRVLRTARAAPKLEHRARQWYERANVLQRQGRLDEAVAWYCHALEYEPEHPHAQFNLATTLIALGRSAEAESVLRQMIARGSAAADVLQNLGIAMAAQQRYSEAADSFTRAVATGPGSSLLFKDLAFALHHESRFTEAIATLERACALYPADIGLRRDFANMLYQHGEFDRARPHFRAVLERASDDRDSAAKLGCIDLLNGDILRGWAGYRRLMRDALVAQNAGIAIDDVLPACLAGETVLLLGEQGIGDELSFLRFAPALKQRGATVIYRAESAIGAILDCRATCVDQICTLADPLPRRDRTALVGDLPMLLGIAAIPPAIALAPDARRIAAMRGRVAACGPPPYIGVTWRAGTAEPPAPHLPLALAKHIHPGRLAPALRAAPGTLLSLQRDPQSAEMIEFAELLGRPLHDFSATNGDLEDMLALMAVLDDYVAVSNTNIHLLAGVGGRARVLVPCPPDWRWMASGTQSPWFPGFTVYRQNGDGDWSAAMQELQRDLAAGPGTPRI